MKGQDDGNTKVVEVGGLKVLSGFMKNDPFRKPDCSWQEKVCMVDHENLTLSDLLRHSKDSHFELTLTPNDL